MPSSIRAGTSRSTWMRQRPSGLKITHILETHLHADFVSGHLDLAERTGAKIYASRSPGSCAFEHVGSLRGRHALRLKTWRSRCWRLRGTRRSISVYVVMDHSRGEDPAAVFTGRYALCRGRGPAGPLSRESPGTWLSKLFHSLHEKLAVLPDFCEVYPAHGAGSLCGRAMSAKRTSTMGYEKKYNYAFQIKDLNKFIDLLTTDMPEAPDHFSRCSDINRKGPALVKNLPSLAPMDPVSFSKRAKKRTPSSSTSGVTRLLADNTCRVPIISTSAATSPLFPGGSFRRTRISCWCQKSRSRHWKR